MGKMSYVCLYDEYTESFLTLSDQAVGTLIKGLMVFLCTGEEPNFKGCERVLWPNLRDKLLRDQKAYSSRCKQNRINGAKGGKSKKANTVLDDKDKQSLADGLQSETNQANQNQNQNQSQNPTKNTGEYIAAAPPRSRFSKPSVKDIKPYCMEQGFAKMLE